MRKLKPETVVGVTLVLLFAWTMIMLHAPLDHAFAQNAGNTGTATLSQAVTYTGSGAVLTSQIFNNIGQSAHYLQFCGTNFNGTIDLEGSFDGATNWTPIAFASFEISPLSGCQSLQAGGYYQNIQSVQHHVSGLLVGATYNASSGPIAYAATGIADGGALSPTVCNHSATIAVSNGATQVVVNGVLNSAIRVCAYSITTTATSGEIGLLQFLTAAANTNTCGSGTTALASWFEAANYPFTAGSGVGMLFSTLPGAALCLTNNTGSGATVYVNVTYTAVYQNF